MFLLPRITWRVTGYSEKLVVGSKCHFSIYSSYTMINTVLASQIMSKACHPYKETAQPKEEKETDSLAQSQRFWLFYPPFCFAIMKGQEIPKPKLAEGRESQNKAVLGSWVWLFVCFLFIGNCYLLIWWLRHQSIWSQYQVCSVFSKAVKCCIS